MAGQCSCGQSHALLEGLLCERLSYDQLFRLSEPKRIARAATARSKQTPVLDQIDATKDETAYTFKFRCYPSTTGLTHQGHIKFFRPRNPTTKLEKLDCEVDCSCPDFRYRWAWAVKQRGSSRVGPQSLNQAWNRAPRITNPSAKPGLCKHILALRNYLYGKTVHFAGHAPDEEGIIEPSGEEQLQGLVTQLNQRAKWRLQKQQQRAAQATSTLVPGVGAKATTQPRGKSAVTEPDAPVPPATAVPLMPKGDFVKAVHPALQKQVATRFIRPESMDPVVSNMKSLLEEQKLISGLLHEVGETDLDFPAEAPAEAPPADEVPELPAPGEGEGAEGDLEGSSEVIELLRGIKAAIEQLGGDEEVPEEGEEEEPIIPPDAEEIDGEDGIEDDGKEDEAKEDDFDHADEA